MSPQLGQSQRHADCNHTLWNITILSLSQFPLEWEENPHPEPMTSSEKWWLFEKGVAFYRAVFKILAFYSKIMSPLTGLGTPTPCPGEWVPLIQDSLAQSHCCLLPRALELTSGDMENVCLQSSASSPSSQLPPHLHSDKPTLYKRKELL